MNIKRQAIINTTGNVVYLIALWMLTVITTQILGYEAVGTLTLAIAVGNVIVMIQLYGMRGYQSSDMSFKYSAYDYLITRLITIIVGLLIGLVFCLLMKYPKQVDIAILYFILIKSSEAFSDVLHGNDQRVGHLELAGYSMFIRGILLVLLFVVGVLVFKSQNTALLMAGCGTAGISIIIDLPLHNRTIRRTETASLKHVLDILNVCFPILISTLIPTLITAIPRIILEKYYGSEVLGYYGNVSSPALLLTTVVPTILIALHPAYGKAFQEKNYQRIKKIWIKSIVGTISLTTVCLFGIFLVGRPVLTFVYTKSIIPYVHYLYYIICAMMLYAVTMCNNTALVAMRKNWEMTVTAVLSLIVCIVVSPLLVQSRGIGGAIAVLVVSYAVQVFAQVIWIVYICEKGIKL